MTTNLLSALTLAIVAIGELWLGLAFIFCALCFLSVQLWSDHTERQRLKDNDRAKREWEAL